jgi:predicted O-methyltransferase YrrM
MLKPASILEIGTHIGSSTIALALSALKNRTEGVNTKIISTDIIDVNDQVNKPWEVFGAPVSPADLLNQIGCEDIVSFEIGNSIDKMSLPRKFDIIFLDGDHRASTVYKEIPVALNCLENDSIIILHDYFPNLDPLWENQMPIAGPFLAIQRFIEEGSKLNILPFGALPWPTKLGSHVTSLAMLTQS